MKQNAPLYLIATLLLVIVLQNAGLLPSRTEDLSEVVSELSEISARLESIEKVSDMVSTGLDLVAIDVGHSAEALGNIEFKLDQTMPNDSNPFPVSIQNVDKYALKWLKYSQDDAVPVKILESSR